MKRTLSQNGNSVTLSIPPAILEELGWKKGDEVQLLALNGQLIIDAPNSKNLSTDDSDEGLQTIKANLSSTDLKNAEELYNRLDVQNKAEVIGTSLSIANDITRSIENGETLLVENEIDGKMTHIRYVGLKLRSK